MRKHARQKKTFYTQRNEKKALEDLIQSDLNADWEFADDIDAQGKGNIKQNTNTTKK